MAILNKYYTTWTSDDSQLYKLEIIPSHSTSDAQDTITSGFIESELPEDFLLKDMTFEASLGDIPIGLNTHTLKITFNVGADGSNTANYSVLRNKILRGTDSLAQPLDGSSVPIGLAQDFEFKCFNTYILSKYSTSETRYIPFFIGCQKFAADNEIELTKLSPVIKVSIEVYDIMRCIGEMIKPYNWFYLLKTKHVLTNYGSRCTTQQYQDKTYNTMDIAYHFQEQLPNYTYPIEYYMYNQLVDGLRYKIQTLSDLFTKIDQMYTYYMVVILCSSCTFNFDKENTIQFYSLRAKNENGLLSGNILNGYFNDVCVVSEITKPNFIDPVYGDNIGGILIDKNGFGQFTNFHEVFYNIFENFLFKGTTTYDYSGGNYSVNLYASAILPDNSSFFTVKQETVYDSVKFKLFNETLNTAKSVVSNLQGERDTTEWVYSEQATSSDNSKDIKCLFHTYPILTNGIKIRQNNDNYHYKRNTINAGTLCYLSEDGEVRKVDTSCKIRFINSGVSPFVFLNQDNNTSQSFEQQVITEQQNNGLLLNLCYALVYTMGRPMFKTVEFRTTSKPSNSVNTRGIEAQYFGNYAQIAYSNLNSVVSVWDPLSPAISIKATVVNYSLDIWSGMADIKLIAHGMEA
jgi:hypothetical protein